MIIRQNVAQIAIYGTLSAIMLFAAITVKRNIKHLFWAIIIIALLLSLGVAYVVPAIDSQSPPPLVINEFVVSNGAGLTDEDGDTPDWIELHNRGSQPINLSDWTLTDNPSDPERWLFPDLTLPAGEYLVVFASGKNRRPTDPELPLHTNFRLGKDGDFLGLYRIFDQRYVDKIEPHYPAQTRDMAYGRVDDSSVFGFLDPPTPGKPNEGARTWEDSVAPVEFSVNRGFFESPFSVVLTTTTPGATIRYTLDGSEPTQTNGKIYSGPLEINGTTSVRAVGFIPNYLPSAINTHSYIFVEDILTQPADPPGFPPTWGTHRQEFGEHVAGSPVIADYEMDPDIVSDPRYKDALKDGLKSVPTMSLVMDIDDFADLYSNPRDIGQSWERPVSVEFINPGGDTDGFQVNAGLRIHGGVGRNEFIPKHSLRLLFKSNYGPATLKYPLFSNSPVEEFNTLVLRSESDRSFAGTGPIRRKATYTRDEWMRTSQLEMSGVGSHGIFVHLYINGLYWGLYNVVERPDARFMASYFGGNEADWFIANQDGPLSRDSNEWTDRLEELFITIGFMGRRNDSFEQPDKQMADHFEAVEPFIDTTQFSDYIILNWYAGTEDWPQNNWYAAIHSQTGNGKHLVWDAQETFEDGAEITLGKITSSRLNIVKPLFEILIQNPDFRVKFADRLYKHLFNEGALTDINAQARWSEINDTIDQAIIAESARWGDVRSDSPITRDDWLGARDAVLAQMKGNAARLINLARQAGYYPSIDPPIFNQHGGPIEPAFELTMSHPPNEATNGDKFSQVIQNESSGEIYYTLTGVDPRQPVTGEIAPDAIPYQIPILLTTTTDVKARRYFDGEWSALNEAVFQVVEPPGQLLITEIMYNPREGGDYEFIELKNNGETDLNLANATFQGIQFTFPPNTPPLSPGEFVVLVRNEAAFAQKYPKVFVSGVYKGQLSNGGETIVLRDPAGAIIASVTYGDDRGWPVSPDGYGDSLTLVDPSADPDEPQSWQAGRILGGSPGRDDGDEALFP